MHRRRLLTALLAVAPLLLVWPAVSHSGEHAVAADTVPAPTATSGTTPGPATTGLPTQSVGDGVRGSAKASVRRSVERALAGAPLPATTRPQLTPTLTDATAGLGACDYGVPHDNPGGRLCPRGDLTATRTVVLYGDSHARHWVPALDALARAHHFKAYYLVKQQCAAPILPNGDPEVAHPLHPWKACQRFRDWAVRTIARLQPDVVITSSSVPTKGIFTPHGLELRSTRMAPLFAVGFSKLWTRLHAVTDARLILLDDVPSRAPGFAPQTCLSQPGATQRTCLSPEHAPALDYRDLMAAAATRVAERARVQVIDPTAWFCWHGLCPGVIGDFLPYRNAGHITRQYSRHLAAPLGYYLHL